MKHLRKVTLICCIVGALIAVSVNVQAIYAFGPEKKPAYDDLDRVLATLMAEPAEINLARLIDIKRIYWCDTARFPEYGISFSLSLRSGFTSEGRRTAEEILIDGYIYSHKKDKEAFTLNVPTTFDLSNWEQEKETIELWPISQEVFAVDCVFLGISQGGYEMWEARLYATQKLQLPNIHLYDREERFHQTADGKGYIRDVECGDCDSCGCDCEECSLFLIEESPSILRFFATGHIQSETMYIDLVKLQQELQSHSWDEVELWWWEEEPNRIYLAMAPCEDCDDGNVIGYIDADGSMTFF